MRQFVRMNRVVNISSVFLTKGKRLQDLVL